MAIDFTRAPFPLTYRELWLPRGINNNATLPSSRYNGHELAFTGARKGTTCDGVHFTGANTSNINCGAIHDNAATYWKSFRFKFDQDYAAGSGDMYIWGKWLDATHFVWLVFKTADGKLYFEGQDGGVNDFSIAAQDGAADITSWNAGQWYSVIASISAANNVRLRIDLGTAVTDASAIAFPNGGDFIIGDFDDPGAGTGFEGVVADFFGGTVDITAGDEGNLDRGIPPANVVNEYLLDEGRGVTAYDRGSGGNNGTLDTTATWAFGQVQQPVISFDCINDHAQSAAGVAISGDLTVVWVGKVKSLFNSTAVEHFLFDLYISASDYIFLRAVSGTYTLQLLFRGSATNASAIYSVEPSIDDYLIIIGTISGGSISYFVNGSLIGTDTGVGAISAAAAIAYIGREHAASDWGNYKPLLVALIDGAFTDKQALDYSRYVRNIFNLPITI